jgi:hypothetical protein
VVGSPPYHCTLGVRSERTAAAGAISIMHMQMTHVYLTIRSTLAVPSERRCDENLLRCSVPFHCSRSLAAACRMYIALEEVDAMIRCLESMK